jgi:hypothetical protein
MIKNPVQDSLRDFVDCIHNSNAILYCYRCNEIYVEYSWCAVAKMECLFTLLFQKIYYYQAFLEICATNFINSENGKLPLFERGYTTVYPIFMFLHGLN